VINLRKRECLQAPGDLLVPALRDDRRPRMHLRASVIAQIVAGEKTQTEVARDERISKPSVSRMMKKFYEKEQKKLGLDVKLT
jgi:hypothetical protein